MASAKMTPHEFETLVQPMLTPGFELRVVSLADGAATLRLGFHPSQLRPGGTLSGPTMMTLIDTALYAAVLARIGLQPLAVTSDLSIRFLRKPPPGDLLGHATLLRASSRTAVGVVEVTAAETGELVAHATGTYAIPRPER